MLASLTSVMPKCCTAAWASRPSTVSVFVDPGPLLLFVAGSVFGLVSSTQMPASWFGSLAIVVLVPALSVWKYWLWTPAQAVPPICWRKSAMYLPAPPGSQLSVALSEPSVMLDGAQLVPAGQAPLWPQPQYTRYSRGCTWTWPP